MIKNKKYFFIFFLIILYIIIIFNSDTKYYQFQTIKADTIYKTNNRTGLIYKKTQEIPKSKKKYIQKVTAEILNNKTAKKTLTLCIREKEIHIENVKKYYFTNKEIVLLEKIVEAEAGTEDEKGKILVANVIINRMNDNNFPNNIEAVIYAKGQFSPVSNGSINTVKVQKTTQKAVQKAIKGEDYSKGALYFMQREASNKNNVTWFDTALTKLFKYGCHEFYN